MNKEIKVGDKVRVRSTTVPKGYNFTYAFGIGSIGKVIQNLGYKDSRCVMVKFGDKVTERESYYEDDLDVLEDNTEEIEELEKEQEAIANPKTMLQEIRFYYDSNKMGDKINEIIRYIKRKDKNND